MNIYKKTIIIITSIVVVLFIVFTIVLWTVNGDLFFIGYNKYFIAPSYDKTDRFLKTNIKELSYVVGELSEMDYDSVTLRNNLVYGEEGFHMSILHENLTCETIVPDDLVRHIEALYEGGIQTISYGRDSVNFTMWSTMDESRGIIYSNTKPDGEQLIEVRQLSKDHWYYYVHNYEKAKEQNPERFQ